MGPFGSILGQPDFDSKMATSTFHQSSLLASYKKSEKSDKPNPCMESSPQDDGGPFYRALRDLKFSPTIIGGRGGGGWGA